MRLVHDAGRGVAERDAPDQPLAARTADQEVDLAREPRELVVGIAVDHVTGDVHGGGDVLDRVPDPPGEIVALGRLELAEAPAEGQRGGNRRGLDDAEQAERRAGPGREADGGAERLAGLRTRRVADADALDPGLGLARSSRAAPRPPGRRPRGAGARRRFRARPRPPALGATGRSRSRARPRRPRPLGGRRARSCRGRLALRRAPGRADAPPSRAPSSASCAIACDRDVGMHRDEDQPGPEVPREACGPGRARRVSGPSARRRRRSALARPALGS